MNNSSCQEVTGVVVNDKLNVSRKKLREFRSLLHHLKTAPGNTFRRDDRSLSYSIIGYANFVRTVNPVNGLVLQETITKLFQNKTLQLPVTPPSNNKIISSTSTPNKPPGKDEHRKPWWKVVKKWASNCSVPSSLQAGIIFNNQRSIFS